MEVKWHENGLGGQDPIMWKGEKVAGEERVDSLDGEEFQGRWLRQGTWREQELGDDRSFFTWDLLSDLGHKTLPWALRCQSAAKLKIFYHRLKIVDQLKVLAELWRKEKINIPVWRPSGRKNSLLFWVVQSLNCVYLFATQERQHTRLPGPSPAPGVCSNSCPEGQTFALFRPSPDWKRPDYIREGNLHYSVYWFKG